MKSIKRWSLLASPFSIIIYVYVLNIYLGKVYMERSQVSRDAIRPKP